MEERRISTDDVLNALQDIRLPVEAVGGSIAELLAALGLGLLLACGVALLLPLVTKRRLSSEDDPQALSALSDCGATDDRALILLYRLKHIAPLEAERLARDIYAPHGTPDIAAIESALRRAEEARV